MKDVVISYLGEVDEYEGQEAYVYEIEAVGMSKVAQHHLLLLDLNSLSCSLRTGEEKLLVIDLICKVKQY